MRNALYILGQLTDVDTDWLVSAGSKRSFPEGKTLIREGETVEALYIVLEGAFAVTMRGSPTELARLGKGDIVGEMSFVESRQPAATVTAVEDSVVLEVPRASLALKLMKDTAFGVRFYRAIAMFLSDKVRDLSKRYAGGGARRLAPGDALEDDELDPALLDSLHLAGTRFHQILSRLFEA